MATITDSFDRANSSFTLGNADTGQAWQVLGSTVWGISSNRAYPAAPGSALDIAVQDVGDGELEAEVSLYGITDAAAGLVFRASDADNFHLVLASHAAQAVYYLEYQAGGFFLFDTVSMAVAEGVTLRAVCEGSTVRVYVDGVLVITRTTTFNQSAGRCGLWYDGNNGARFEDFSAASLAAETFVVCGRGAAQVLNAFSMPGGGAHRAGYDTYAGGFGRGRCAMLSAFAAVARGASHSYATSAMTARGAHRIGYEAYAAASRGAHLVYASALHRAGGVHRVSYEAFAGAGRGVHALLNGYTVAGRGTHRVASLSVTHTSRGTYRVANAGLDRYELYRGVNVAPDFAAAPWQTFAGLPFTTPALAAGNTYRFVLRRRNAWGLGSENVTETTIVVAADGTEAATPPSPPANVATVAAAGRTVLVTADYDYGADGENAADLFAVFVRADGTDPDPAVDVAALVEAFQADGVAKLEYTAGPFAEGATVKVLVRMRRSGSPGVDSTNTDVHAATATAFGPGGVAPVAALLGRVLGVEQG